MDSGLHAQAASKTSPVLTGIPAAHLEQVRETLEAQVSFAVSELDKADDGAGHWVAAHESAGCSERSCTGSGRSAGGCSGNAAERLDGDIRLCWQARTRRSSTPGSIIAVDADYTGQTGFVGAPVSGAYVRQALTDVDYIRRVTFNVALVSQS